MKKISYLLEFFIVIFLIMLFRFFPINFVSLVGGKFFQLIGPRTKSHQTAILNIDKVFPNLNLKEKENIILKSWNNLGKTFIEFVIIF